MTQYDFNHILPSPFDCLATKDLIFRSYSKDARVFRQGDKTNGMFIVESGHVVLSRVTEAGVGVTMFNAFAGDVFAEASLYSDVYHCDATCIAESTIVRIPKALIVKRQQDDPEFSSALTERLSLQVQEYRQLLALHAIKSAKERVLQAIALGRLRGSVTLFSGEIGLTKEACYRALRELTENRIVLKTGHGKYALSKQKEDYEA